MRRTRIACVAIALVATAGCTASERSPDAAGPSAAASADALPSTVAPLPDCTLTVSGRSIGLREDEAVQLTDLAAAAVRRGESPARFAGRLAGTPLDDVRRPAAAALLGRAGPALTCTRASLALTDQRLGPLGLTPRAARLRSEIRRAFGSIPMGGFAAGGVDTGHVDNSAHYEGRALDVFLRPHQDRANARRGWVLSQWLVAHGGRLDLLSVIYRDHIWTVWASALGWRDYVHPGGPTRNPVLRHLDHVHTAVIGGPYRG